MKKRTNHALTFYPLTKTKNEAGGGAWTRAKWQVWWKPTWQPVDAGMDSDAVLCASQQLFYAALIAFQLLTKIFDLPSDVRRHVGSPDNGRTYHPPKSANAV